MTKNLTDKQQIFLNVLFDQALGDVLTAKKLAGYSDGTSTSEVIRALKDEIAEATKEYLARVAPRAAFSMANALNDPTELGIRDKMAAAKDLLDRTGYSKTEKMEVSAPDGIFILPPKNQEQEKENN
tara:strand:+ start:127 stop:507 length:381 start_codon:yes stop_codon:yes gene_type:complete